MADLRSDAERNTDLLRYGMCWTCGWPRTVLYAENDGNASLSMVCPNPDCTVRDV
ncbi:MAG: hypothetical protein ACR2MN_14605 [Acidimicrobiales bacterium]